MTIDQKRKLLEGAAAILGASIHGLSTRNPEELGACARDLAANCDVIVVAGGDGTFSDIINAIDTARKPVAFLPLGTGNALRHALEYRGNIVDIATRIKEARIREYDLINCGNKKRAFMASVGFDGTVLLLRERYVERGIIGPGAFVRSFFRALIKEYEPVSAKIAVDGHRFEVENMLNLMVVKQPYYGFGMKVIPQARFDDGFLHVLNVRGGILPAIIGGATAFTLGNRVGKYYRAQEIKVSLPFSMALQLDGNIGWASKTFHFSVIPRGLKIKC